jgi:enolase
MSGIRSLHALEVLDSRGRPTVSATCELSSGVCGEASVPSGASTGAAEAVELRDGDPARFRGLGCRRAVAGIREEMQRALVGRDFDGQEPFDRALIALDGTPDKSRLGANAVLAVSLAFARAAAAERGVPLYLQLRESLPPAARRPLHLPRPTINLFSGGKHAGGQVPVQDVLLVPASVRRMDEALAMAFAVYQAAAELALSKYGARALVADEGGLAPPFPSVEAMLADAVEAIEAAGLAPGKDAWLAIDVASSHFHRQGAYLLGNEAISGDALIARLLGWLDRFPIASIEDGLAEDDWEHWPILRTLVGRRALVLGDDLLCTQAARIRRAIACGAADALLLKVNQVGTLTEAAESSALARAAGWRITVSARSGETEDHWLADLAVGWSGDQVKIGSITRSERLAKYNRLLVIEEEADLELCAWPELGAL